MPAKLLFMIIGFNSLVAIFLASVIVIYFRPNQFGMMASFFFGWLTGFINLETVEPQFPVLLLLAFGFFLGFTTPKGVWKYAVVLGLFVPLSQFIWIGVTHQNGLLFSDGIGSLISFIPAFGGTYLGKFIAGVHRAKLGSVNGLIADESHH
jgi:hypothetical protein